MVWRGWERSRSHEVLVGLEAHHLAARKPDGTLRREVKGKKRPFVARSGPAWALLGPHSATRRAPTPSPHLPSVYPLCGGSPALSSPFTSFWISLPSPPIPSIILPFRSLHLSSPSSSGSPVPHTNASKSWRVGSLGAFLKFVSLPAVAAPAAPATHRVVLYTLTTEYDRETNLSSPFRLNTNPYVWGVWRRKCADYITPLYKIADQPSYPHRPSQIGRPFTDGPTNRSTDTDKRARIIFFFFFVYRDRPRIDRESTDNPSISFHSSIVIVRDRS